MNKVSSKSNKTLSKNADLKPLMCYVSVEELEQIEEFAEKEFRSRSASARMLILLGLEQYKSRQQ